MNPFMEMTGTAAPEAAVCGRRQYLDEPPCWAPAAHHVLATVVEGRPQTCFLCPDCFGQIRKNCVYLGVHTVGEGCLAPCRHWGDTECVPDEMRQ